LEGFSREQVTNSRCVRSSGRAARDSAASALPGAGANATGVVILDHDEFIRSQTTLEGLGALKLSFDKMGEMGFHAVAIQPLSASGTY